VYLFFEAIERIKNPSEIKTGLMMTVAVIGLIANLIAVFILHRDSKSSINVKAAYLHLIGDSLSSVVVLIGALIIHFFSIYWIDPFITFFIGAYILYEAVKILGETVKILMQDTPPNVDLQHIRTFIEKDERIRNIHHIHVWNLTDNRIYFEAHVNLMNDLQLSSVDTIRSEVETILKQKFDIHHTTLQFEYMACEDEQDKQED
jgi:cobalt-zinc-cadmium efflux system protein